MRYYSIPEGSLEGRSADIELKRVATGVYKLSAAINGGQTYMYREYGMSEMGEHTYQWESR